jgi:hypothetical protein
MPLKKCQTNNEPGWKWGDGFCYRYDPNSKSSETRARKRALAQALAQGYFIEEYKSLFNALESFQESYNDYPDSVKNNAQRGIDLNKEVNNKCATQVGKVRAQQLANGEKVSVETIKRMYSYLSRAEVYYDNGTPEDCGYISYLLWGGKSAKEWAENKLRQIDNQ